MMIETFRKKADEYLDSAVMLLSQLISFPSVMGESSEGAPFGKECADVVKFVQESFEDEFVTKNFDNYCVTLSFNNEPAELGILAHLDVVPVEGQKWSSDPFTADIRDGRIYGRGSIDDKGPAAACITAMRIIRDMGLPIKRNCRLILGSNEENGSEDMEYYLKKEPFPPMLFTPDGEFPIISVEKGMIRCGYSGKYTDDTIISLKGGSVVNAVPERAEAVLDISMKEHTEKLPSFDGVEILREIKDNTVVITAVGKGAHASTPEGGKNALTALLELLSSLPLKGELSDKVKLLSSMYPYGETDGASAGIKCSDERSGALTSVLSIADCKNGSFDFQTDTRFPVSKTSEQIINALEKRHGAPVDISIKSEPHCADEDSEMVKTLLKVYEECTGEKGKCLAIGGGTYVHETTNGVAFGAEWDDKNNMHGADEFIGIEELKKDIFVYTDAIYRLCCE